jgi:enterochelin esterase-like enzyme
MTGLSAGRRRVGLFCAAFVVVTLCLCVGLTWPTLPRRLTSVARRALKLDWVDPDRSAPAGTKYRTFFSRTMQRDVSYLIYLPPDYERAPDKRYPVIYWLHSRGGTQREGATTFVPRFDAAIRSGKVPAAIIVLPNGLGVSRWSDSSDGKRPVESVVVGELIPHIDHSYRTSANRRHRALEGFSMGGFGAAHLGFKYPEIFGAVAMDSGALFDESKNAGYLEANSPWNLVVRNTSAIQGETLIRMAVGEKDSMLDLNRQFDLLLDGLKIEHEYVVLPGIGHNEERLYALLGDRTFAFYVRAFGR